MRGFGGQAPVVPPPVPQDAATLILAVDKTVVGLGSAVLLALNVNGAGLLLLDATGVWVTASGQFSRIRVKVDGVNVGAASGMAVPYSGPLMGSVSTMLAVAAGVHLVELWAEQNAGGTFSCLAGTLPLQYSATLRAVLL